MSSALVVLAAAGAIFLAQRSANAANPDTQNLNVTASLTASLSVTVADTLDCGEITSAITDCSATGGRSGTAVTIDAVGYDFFTVAIANPVTMDGPGTSFNITVNPYTDVGGTTALSGTQNVPGGGTATIYAFPDAIGGLTATTLEGVYFGSTTITITAS